MARMERVLRLEGHDRATGNVVWFDRSSGLSVYEETDDKMIAFAFEYGDAVKESVVRR